MRIMRKLKPIYEHVTLLTIWLFIFGDIWINYIEKLIMYIWYFPKEKQHKINTIRGAPPATWIVVLLYIFDTLWESRGTEFDALKYRVYNILSCVILSHHHHWYLPARAEGKGGQIFYSCYPLQETMIVYEKERI